MNDKEIAKELALALVDKLHVEAGKDHCIRLTEQFAEVYKKLYVAVRDADKN